MFPYIILVEMACSQPCGFDSALSYALQRLGTPLLKPKPEQVASIKCVYERRDVFVWLPTGFGKSLCYEALPFVMDFKYGRVDSTPCSVVIVVSPLVALMVDQVRSLRRKSVKAAIITSGEGVDKELLANEEDLKTCSLLYCAPEAIVKQKWREVIEKPVISGRIVAVVVDEAHCVSQW